MNKCQHCGAFVPAEKAFCPNCSEPMEPEEAPNRAHSFSSEMLATIRDDPEKYRQMMAPPAKKTPEGAAPPASSAPASSVPASAPPVAYSAPEVYPAPPPAAAGGERSYLLIIGGIVAVLLLVFVILYALKIV